MDIKYHNGCSYLYIALARLYQYFNFKSKNYKPKFTLKKNKIKLKKPRPTKSLFIKSHKIVHVLIP